MEAIHKIYKIKREIAKVPIIQKTKSVNEIIFEELKRQLHPSKTLLFLSNQMLQKITWGTNIAFFFLAFLPKKPSYISNFTNFGPPQLDSWTLIAPWYLTSWRVFSFHASLRDIPLPTITTSLIMVFYMALFHLVIVLFPTQLYVKLPWKFNPCSNKAPTPLSFSALV